MSLLIDKIRRIKWSYATYNLFKKKELSHNVSRFKQIGLNKKYFSSISSKDFAHFIPDIPWLDKENSKNVLPENYVYNDLEDNIQKELLTWSDKGYLVLKTFFNEEEVNGVNKEIDLLIESDKVNWKANNTKIMFAIHQSDYINKIGNNPKMLSILSMLLGKEVLLFQSINFLMGSEQRTHSDSIHMTTFPQGYLIAVWIALEDITLENGPLHYYPGSHKLNYVMNNDFQNEGDFFFLGSKSYTAYEDKIQGIIKEKELKQEVFTAKRGDILIWHANLLHGGNPHLNKQATRKSVVFHYYAKDVICYHEISQRPALIKK